MRITLVISTLAVGGAQRVLTLLANHWAGLGWSVTLLALDKRSDEADFFPVDPPVQTRWLATDADSRNVGEALANNLRRIAVLRRALSDSRPDVVLSFIDQSNVLTLLASRGLDCPVVVSERTMPGLDQIGRIWSWLRLQAYRRASSVVVQTDEAFAWFPEAIRRKAVIIPNPIAVASWAREDVHTVAGVGRLVPVKGFDRLIDAFALAAARHPDWSLVLWGEGFERRALETQCERLGLAGRVRLPGMTNAPVTWPERTGIFVLSSRYEGFPNALGEAMAAGLPVIAMNCRSGPSEMIRDGENGILVPADDMQALAAALDRMMADPRLRRRLGSAARATAARWAPDRVFAEWTTLLTHTTAR